MSDSIYALLQAATQSLSQSPTPRLDAQVLLCHAIAQPKTYLITHPEAELSQEQRKTFETLIKYRQQGEPIAYILGHKEFWSLDFAVNPDVLIPRPETELLVELALERLPEKSATVADLGTGSGCIAISLAIERPNWQLHATDQSAAALKIAQHNIAQHGIKNIRLHQGEWCQALPAGIKFDAIISNPPYIDASEPELQEGDVRFEPQSALVSHNQGIADIEAIIKTAKAHLKPQGLLMIEHGYQQGPAAKLLFDYYGYHALEQHRDLAGNMRVSLAKA